MRDSNVQVTLQILTSIIEKSPRDLPLYGHFVLSIISTALGSKNIDMIEESVPTVESYCKYADAASSAADQNRAKQYKNVIHQFANYGQLESSTSQPVPTSTRRRTIALKAIRAVVGSDAIAVDTSDQLDTVMPLILENLDLEKGSSIAPLQQKAHTGEKRSIELAQKRRMSNATMPSIDEAPADPANATETTADADKAAEEEVRVLAVRCLKQIFSVSTGTSRAQVRLGTTLVLRYIASRERPRLSTRPGSSENSAHNWATTLFETIARWTPVQDRFIIVITTVETLVRSPIVEAILEKQLILASLVDWLLRSDINLIGLSVMDVLLRLIQHTLLLLQLGSRELSSPPQPPGADTLGLYRDMATSFDPTSSLTEPERGRLPDTKETAPSPVRKELLSLLQKCISDLATHIYYTDQISDMLTAIMARLKPSTTSDVPTAAAAINDPAAATRAIIESASLQEDPATDGFFSFATAQVVALKAVKDILRTANSRRISGGQSEVRSRVGVQVWDGTQWLLKDDEPEVRTAYVDAIITWLRLETNKADTLLPQDGTRKPRSNKRVANGEESIAKRAVSNASRKGEKPTKSTFLQLLHLAIYDQAVTEAENESTILMLHLLLWTLVERLGINAVRAGLPMILNLQGAVLNGNDHSPTGKSRIASLVHGYLWAIAEKFDFESLAIGTEINAEISRRKRFACWIDRIRFPPLGLSHISTAGTSEKTFAVVSEEAADSIRPFLNVNALVDEVANAYDQSLISPPSSPPGSPGRLFSVPTLGFGYGYNSGPVHKPSPENQVPQKVKDEMTASWSREACLAAIDEESNPSIAGSRTAASSIGRQHLSVAGKQNGVGASGRNTPQDEATSSPTHPVAMASGLGSLSRAREYSTASSLRDPDTSSRDSTMRISDLKRALAGQNGDLRGQSPLRRLDSNSRRSTHSAGSESMVSWNPDDDDSLGEAGIEKTHSNTRSTTAVNHAQQATSDKDTAGMTFHDQATITSNPKLDDDIPPVPKIPSALNLPMPGTWQSRDPSPVRQERADTQATSSPLESIPAIGLPPRPHTSSQHTLPKSDSGRKLRSRPASRAGAASVYSHSTGRKTDLNSLLASIKVRPPEDEKGQRISSSGSGKIMKPPY